MAVHGRDSHVHNLSRQSDNSILARVRHHVAAVLAIAVRSWDQGNQPGQFRLQVVNLQQDHTSFSVWKIYMQRELSITDIFTQA